MNIFGKNFRVEIFGESHGPCVGAIIDGCPPGINIDESILEKDLERRRAKLNGTTERREADIPRIMTGVFNAKSTGAPILIIFNNNDKRSEDYSAFLEIPRPGHADFTSRIKFKGFSDPRGSGHFSGRITTGLVASGVIAKHCIAYLLDTQKIEFKTKLLEAGGNRDIEKAINSAKDEGDSIGSLIEIIITNLPPGLGEPFFDSVESVISHAIFSIPAVRAIEFGDGFSAAKMKGSQHNDPFISVDGKTSKNGAGGINGGITNGNDIIFRVAVKPASSIGKDQSTLNFSKNKEDILKVVGRHDACIGIRAAVALESAAAIAIADLVLTNINSQK